MSCKYCELKMRPINGSLKVLKGENWEDEYGEGGYIEQSHDDEFQMHILYDAGYAYTSVDNIKYCPFCGSELTMPKEPLIKIEKIRKIVKAWAKANAVSVRLTYYYEKGNGSKFVEFLGKKIEFYDDLGLTNGEQYCIEELCGEE